EGRAEAVDVALRGTGPGRVEPGSTAPPPGGVVSITTVAVWFASTFPVTSVERYVIVCEPSFEWSAGAGTRTIVPVCHAPPSILNSVVATPEPASLGVRVTVTSADCGPDGALSTVAGAVLSTRMPPTSAEAVGLPDLSVATA